MPKILKAKLRKVKTKTKRKPTTGTKAKRQKTETKTKTKTKTKRDVVRMDQTLKLPDKVNEPKVATEQIHAAVVKKNDQLASEVLPKVSYTLEVDGRLKSEHQTQEAALAAALELKQKFPHIRVAIVDPKGPKRIAVELPQGK
jgi:hypothetical protein